MAISYFPIFDPQDSDSYIPDWPSIENRFLGGGSERRSREYKRRSYKARFMLLSTWKGAASWQASHAYSVGDYVKDGSYIYMAVQAGTTGSGSPPTWPTTEEATVVDGGVVWICYNSNQITCVLNFIDSKKGRVVSFYVWLPLIQSWILAVFPGNPLEIMPVNPGRREAVDVEITFEETF